MAVPNSRTLDFDALVSTTVRAYLSKTLHDNIFEKNVILAWLKGKGRYLPQDGGEYLTEPLMYGKNTTVKSFSGYDTIDVVPQEGISVATFNWKGVAGTVVISEEEMLKNNGKERVINLLEAKVFQLEESIMDQMTDMIFSDGTGNSSKDITGLTAMVGTTGTYGGIARGTYTWWQSKVDSDAEALAVTDMRSIYNQAGGNKTKVDLIVTTRALFEAYEALAYGKTTWQGETTSAQAPLANLGFDTLKFKGAELVYDESCTSGVMYMLNSDFVKLRYHPNANFKDTEKQQPNNQIVWSWKTYWFGNMTTGNCRRLGKLTGKT